MAMKNNTSPNMELTSLEPLNYRKYFRALCWSGTRRIEVRTNKRLTKREKLRRWKATSAPAICYAPAVLGNPSQFTVYATVRRAILARWRNLPGVLSEYSSDSENDEPPSQLPIAKLPKVTGIGLRAVFSLVSQARFTDAHFCEHALKALLDVLQGHPPEELAQEPTEIIENLHAMLVEVASGSGPSGRLDNPTKLTSMGSSCLLALSVARGESELILNAIATLIMSATSLSDQSILIPTNQTKLQRSVQSMILGTPSRNQWLHFGVPSHSSIGNFSVDLPTQLTTGSTELVVRSLASDGCFLYIYTSRGLLKIGSGYGSSIQQHVYLYKPYFYLTERHGWLGFCKNKLYVRIGRKKTELYEIDKETLELIRMVKLEPGSQTTTEPKSAVFTDGNQLGLILLTNYDSLTIKMYELDSPAVLSENTVILSSRKDLKVPLLRQRTLALGRAPFDDSVSRRVLDLDAPVAMQYDDSEEDKISSVCAGQEFGLLLTQSGKVYYTGKGASLGYKTASPHTGRWTLMKETLFARSDVPNMKRCRVKQVAMGHEGVHAILVLDSGAALFTGIARRGEDGDSSRARRTPKPTRPKKIFKAEGHNIIYAACNYGSTALVTRVGQLVIYGKDTQHCDSQGLLQGMRNEKIVQVALGKAHCVILTTLGQVYTFGINNKGQCGREFGYTKEKAYSLRRKSAREDIRICTGTHMWVSDYCRICVLCKECTGFGGTCHCAHLPNRIPREKCGCGEGDSGCTTCGVCQRCAEVFVAAARQERVENAELDDDIDASKNDTSIDKENSKFVHNESQGACSETEKDPSSKVASLPPARVAIPGGHRVITVACGLHHTVLLTEVGDVLTFGSNQYGQLGAGDISVHHKLVRVRVPKASGVAAGSNHTAIMTRDGELYTFGNYTKGALGRPRIEETSRSDRTPIWYATPGRVPQMGPRYACKAVAVSACGDQTYIRVSQLLIKTDTLFSSTIAADHKSIVILPNRPEHAFKCITINKKDGTCNAWTGPEQVDFVNSLACLDPLYDVLWGYAPQMRVMSCYNIQAFDPHKLQQCRVNDPDSFAIDADYDYPNYGTMKRLEDFKNIENFELTCNMDEKAAEEITFSTMSVLNQELAIPSVPGCFVTRMHAALHLLGCIDSLTYAQDKPCTMDCKKDNPTSPTVPIKEDFLTASRFESHGGGWGYSGNSVEAIRFMCDTDILLGGYGLFGGRGDYGAKVKLFDIGVDGGDQEGDGELIAESDEIVYECPPRDRFPVLFDVPVPLTANRWYVAWACITGPSSDCGSSGQAMVINDEVGFHFKTSKKSNNGTDVNSGQIPCLLYNTVGVDHQVPVRIVDPGEPIAILSRNLSKKVTVSCFKSLITLLQWSWNTFKEILLETNGLVSINYQKLNLMKHQKRLVYVIRACLKLINSYINEIYPQNRKRNSQEYLSYLDAIADARNIIQTILADPTPTCSMLPRKPGKNKAHRACYVQFALDLTNSVLTEAHETLIACFHAFFPTPSLKWHHLCYLLFRVKDGVVPPSQIRELTAACAAMCMSRSLRDAIQYITPVTQNYITVMETRRPESKVVKDVPTKSATVPRSSHAQKPPPIPPRSNRDSQKITDTTEAKTSHKDFHLLDVIPRLLDIVLIPIKQQMMTRQCGRPHDHGEIRQHEILSDYCCKLTSRIVAELFHNATIIKRHPREFKRIHWQEAGELGFIEDDTSGVKHIVTPSRFMRVNQSRAWNTGNGSPDAICFTVDRPGIVLVGASIYGGVGNFEYSLELLHDVRLRATADEPNPAHCWISVEVVHGAFATSDCQHDMVQAKFERPVPLTEDLRYAIRLCNHGGRTSNGDCGLPSVKGPDGTTFRFTSCSLSFNGTSLARGQIPCLIYYGTTKSNCNIAESADTMVIALKTITQRVATLIMERGTELFCTLRNELTAEDLRRNAAVLQNSPAINTLIPYTLANLEGLEDPKNIIDLLEMIHKLLPHVSAMNLLVPNKDDVTTKTTSNFYTWVESDHPYKQATVSNMRVLFPACVSWIVLEMDPRSITAQPEDTLTIYAVAGAPRHRCHCVNTIRLADPPFRKVYKRLVPLTSESGEAEVLSDDGDSDTVCMHYNCTYIGVTPKLSNIPAEWPQKALLVPGNEVIFSLETASDYLTDYNTSNNEDNRYGFRCLCVGYVDTPFTSKKNGLLALEMELIYSGAAFASRLLAPDLEIPPLSHSTAVEVQVLAMMGAGSVDGEPPHDGSETILLSRGLELSSSPTVHQVLNGQPLVGCMSTERQFLSDFVLGAECTAGGRLAQWLAPIPCVEPAKCELKPPLTPPRPSLKVNIPVILRDQYGDSVTSPACKVEVVVQRMEESGLRQKQATLAEGILGTIPDVPYNPVVKDNSYYYAISMIKAYQNYSFEELRYASGLWGEQCKIVATVVSVPAERLAVQVVGDGSCVASWTPRAPGAYIFRCTLDDMPTPQELTVDVPESSGCLSDCGEQFGPGPSTPPYKLRKFVGTNSAGLRVRASPSLQAEEIGRIPPGDIVAFVEEVVNKDGTWVRLSVESTRAYTETFAEVAWCLHYHEPLGRHLLMFVDDDKAATSEFHTVWSGYSDDQGVLTNYNDDDIDVGTNGPDEEDERRLPLPYEVSLPETPPAQEVPLPETPPTNDVPLSWEGESPYGFHLTPKRGKHFRSESTSMPTPRRTPRRSNGNSEEWYLSARHRSSDNVRDDPIVETESPSAASEVPETTSSRLAQTGTQTSPEGVDDNFSIVSFYTSACKETQEPRTSPKSLTRDRITNRNRAYRRASSPPPLPARTVPAPPPPRKNALSPAQAECLRAIFASLLWHEGIVHDAIACAAYLKFHPQLPKQGTTVVTRGGHDVPLSRPQRHSVEVTNAGHYLNIHPSTLETLTRSGMEASTSRARRLAPLDGDVDMTDAQMSSEPGPSTSVVNVLPPALRALVALWDTLYESNQLSVATDSRRLNDEVPEKNQNEEKVISGTRKKRNGKISTRATYYVTCELCGGANVCPPLVTHLQMRHPGCRAPTVRGYDRSGVYKRVDPFTAPLDIPAAACGRTTPTYVWYIFCERCRDKALKAASSSKQSKAISDVGNDPAVSDLDHHLLKENAMFLLDLAPLTSSTSTNSDSHLCGWSEGSSRSPPSPPGSMWQPAPPFQCLPALGALPKDDELEEKETTKYHSLGRPHPTTIILEPLFTGYVSRVHRSVSMGQAGGRELSAVAWSTDNRLPTDKQDTLPGAGSSLLAQPSAALQRLVGCGDWINEGCTVSAFEAPRIDAEALMSSHVLTFILSKRDLHAYRQKMDAAIRLNTVRQYAFEALNWLLRSTTQPTCVHDVMWWFCTALEKYARIVPPPVALDDNRENVANDVNRTIIPTASTSAICPGGRSARGARAAFHSFLGSVSALAPSLPPASAAGLQAVRCWALQYTPHDRAFLHRVISKILSHPEDGPYDDAMIVLHESFQSFLSKEIYVWGCPDVTGWTNITVSSRQGMAGALTDGSTETFWESGDEDRNKTKWIQITYPGAQAQDERPHIICVHIDNTRDTVSKTLLVSFLYSGGSSEMFHMTDVEVDPKTAPWLCYTLPRVMNSPIRVRIELRGPEPSVRVRQVRVLGAPAPLRTSAASPAGVLHSLSEADTLRVFRLLTSQVFGTLLEWDHIGSDSGAEVVTDDVPTAADDNDLREHVVGILFAGHKLTSLQKQVMTHIVAAIGCEASKARDDWETALLYDEDDGPRPLPQQQDNYCFEMLSLLLALSGSAVGRVHLAQRTELLGDLLALLHTGSERVQRQVITLLRRMISEVPPQKMLMAINIDSELNERVTLLDHLICYLGKAITVQVKIKGSSSNGPPASIMMGETVSTAPPAVWYMRGETNKKHAYLAAKLLSDMAEDKVSPSWGPETRTALTMYVSQVARMADKDRRPECCIAMPTVWMALAALCVCEQSHIECEIINHLDGRDREREDESRALCANHEDGATVAVIDCRTCGALCAECDRFLHLKKSSKTHHRQICKEEESSIRIDIHEGCGRAKTFWLLLLVDRRTLKALAEFRGIDNGICERPSTSEAESAKGMAGVCRFCGARGNSGLLAIGNVCADHMCQEHGRESCTRILPCGHLCSGVRGERKCLPCLYGCTATEAAPLRQDADDMCMICFTDPLQAAPAIQLTCGHVFHLHCCKKVLVNKWIGPRITFSFSQCPICKEDMSHWTLEELLTPIRNLHDEVKRKALMRLEYEGFSTSGGSRGRVLPEPAEYAMEKYAYYVCHKCGKAYFGGLARCEAEVSGWWDPEELVCGACSDVAGARICPKHGSDFLEYKCRYCCSVAVFFCFGTSHFCNSCHDDFQRVTNIPKNLLPQCPAGPKGEQLPGTADECPLHVRHPSTGEEFALGCGVCRHAHVF